MRFRTKTILGVALIEMALLAILIGSALSILRESSEAELTRRVQLGGKLLAAAAKDAAISQDLATLDSLANEAMASGQIDFVRILDGSGIVLTERGSATFLRRAFQADANIDQISDGIFDWSVPLMAGNIRHGEVQLAVSTDPLRALLASTRRWAAGIGGMEMLLVALFSWLLGSYLARQLVELREASQRIAVGDFDHRVPVRGNDELAQTASAFNLMAQQLSEHHELLRKENLKCIEAQREAEQAQTLTEDKNEQLNAIFELSPDGFVCFDRRLHLMYASPAFLSLTGLQESDIRGLDEESFSAQLARVCVEEARFPGVAQMRAAQQTGDASQRWRHRIALASAGKRVLECDIRLSRAATVAQILYFRDVTHETEVDRLKSEFLSTAAHELRTPMTSIYGFAELLLERDFSEADRRDFLETIVRQSQLTVSIVNELLDLVRIEEQRGKDFVIEKIELQELLDEIASGFHPPEGRHPPTLSLDTAPIRVRADRKKITQAIGNVLSNAYKYSSPGGAVEIALAVHHADDDTSPRACIRVTDHGIGMTEQQLARVGERFYRADTSGKIPGTGLGMSIVREIVNLHGGQLELASKLGEGTTVTLSIPAAIDGPATTPENTSA